MTRIDYNTDYGQWLMDRMPVKTPWPKRYITLGVIRDDVLAGVFALFDWDDEVVYLSGAGRRNVWVTREAVEAVRAFAFNQLKVQRILAQTQPDNEACMRMLKRCGFRFVKGVSNGYGPDQPMLIFALERTERIFEEAV